MLRRRCLAALTLEDRPDNDYYGNQGGGGGFMASPGGFDSPSSATRVC